MVSDTLCKFPAAQYHSTSLQKAPHPTPDDSGLHPGVTREMGECEVMNGGGKKNVSDTQLCIYLLEIGGIAGFSSGKRDHFPLMGVT